MPSDPLDNLVRIGKLKTEPPSQPELDGLIRSGTVRLRDAENTTLSLESRFDLACNAAHALALAAMRFRGYHSESRYLVFQCLQHTLGLSAEQWRVLDQAHGKWKRTEYEGSTEIDLALVDAVLRVVRELAARLAALGSVANQGSSQ